MQTYMHAQWYALHANVEGIMDPSFKRLYARARVCVRVCFPFPFACVYAFT